jgi:hypothetical protein
VFVGAEVAVATRLKPGRAHALSSSKIDMAKTGNRFMTTPPEVK